jgi:tetratricopeptide (TPR) repeat protein
VPLPVWGWRQQEPGLSPERANLRVAKEAAQRAVELDDELGDGYMALGIAYFLYDWNWEAAEPELRRGRELGTSDPVLRALAPSFFFVTGHPTEARGWMREAVAAAPNDPFVRTRRVELMRALGRGRDALAEVKMLVADLPGHGPSRMQLQYTLESRGDIEGLLEQYRPLVNAPPRGYEWLPGLVREGERVLRSEGLAAFWRFSANANLTDHFFDPVRAAGDFVRAAAYDDAFDALEQAYRMKVSAILWVPQSAEFAPLRSDPRFASLAKRLDLPIPTHSLHCRVTSSRLGFSSRVLWRHSLSFRSHSSPPTFHDAADADSASCDHKCLMHSAMWKHSDVNPQSHPQRAFSARQLRALQRCWCDEPMSWTITTLRNKQFSRLHSDARSAPSAAWRTETSTVSAAT